MTEKSEASADARRRPSRPAKPPRPVTGGLTPRGVLLAVVAFSMIFGAIIAFKLQQEWAATVEEAEGTQARTAAFLAERVSGRLAEVRGALAFAVADLSAASPGELAEVALPRLRTLSGATYISDSALLLPDGTVIRSDGIDSDARAAAEAALAHPSGVATLLGDPSWIVQAAALPLSTGEVGAILVWIDPAEILPEGRPNQISILATDEGRALALQPRVALAGAPYAAERVGLDPDRVAALAGSGGALSGANLAGEARILGVAALADAPLHTYSLGPAAIDRVGWRRTLIFYLLMFLGPLFAAVALCALLLIQMGKLKSTQAQLEDSERRFRLAIEGARCGVWDWDLETDDVFITESFARMVGRKEAAVVSGPEFLSLLDPEDRGKVRSALRGAVTSGEVNLEARANALALWMQMRGRPMASEKGEARRIMGVAIDITERKGAQARVAAAEHRLRAALESMNESFVLWDSRRRLVLWNRKFREFFGLEEGQLKTGMAYADAELAAGKAIHAVHMEGDESDTYEMELKDGRWLHYSQRVTNDGGLVSVGADITALKRQEATLKANDRQLRQTVDSLRRSQDRIQELAKSYEEEKIRAEQANRSKSEFLANMSHELRTPLNAINGFSEMMMKEIFGPLGHARYSEYAVDIYNSGQHLLSLINDILDMSKIEAGKMILSAEPVLPGELIEQCLRLVGARAAEKSITVAMEGEDLPEIEADPRAIKQVLLNLLSNAVKFTPEGGRVVVRGFNAVDGIVLQVADTGIGIPEEDLPRLGRPFEQIEAHHSRKHEGSGLGLALSKSLVELHGGTLRIDSVLGKGTTVSFTLPARLPLEAQGEFAHDAAE
ncbi:PAS domain-containing sensor histidine kinase [Marinicauda algicola]|uniref:histidine kinase n=1 Tax=Marinicauda algicola TaxID=2029849 RepID=A0A4S2H3M5_9PROT|nr:PAS domain-containing sensor histidine kinase [Marinicauda algicola]TGY89961.1 PAS domain-containing sensor histidine kinase [Marinicauda algicola]